MKTKYLIQIQTNNASMGATGWFTVHGAQTKTAADALAADFRHARPVTDTRAVRVISANKFTEENRAANHAAMRATA
jgi:outer membrane receptor for monomeric catechols